MKLVIGGDGTYKMKAITMFRCKFCTMLFVKDNDTHENECDLNPENKRCVTCNHCFTHDMGYGTELDKCKASNNEWVEDVFDEMFEEGHCPKWDKLIGKHETYRGDLPRKEK